MSNGSANMRSQAPTKQREENIFLFIPNLIGYSRIILAIASLYYMPLHPRTCTILYAVSCLLDALDGVAARKFQQSTKFGAVLDMVTDRCTTSCLLVFLASAFPRWSIVFQGLISLDLASHYMHMYATLTMGGAGSSHKKIERNRSWILMMYYSDNVSSVLGRSDTTLWRENLLTWSNCQVTLFVFCALNELFFIALYLLSFSSPTLSPSLLANNTTASSPIQPGAPAPSAIFTTPWSAGAMEMAR